MRAYLAHHGVGLGVAVLVLVTVAAWLLARKAAQGVATFRPDQHEDFLSRRR